MKTKRTLAGAIAIVALSGMLVAAQMQMPDKSSNKPGEASAMPNTLTGIVSDSMCGAHHMAKDKSPAECIWCLASVTPLLSKLPFAGTIPAC